MSTDPEFSRKAADVVGLYLNPPENVLVLCEDEKPLPSSGACAGLDPLTQRSGTEPLLHMSTNAMRTTTLFGSLTRSYRSPNILQVDRCAGLEAPKTNESEGGNS